jgi:hypothetical protein
VEVDGDEAAGRKRVERRRRPQRQTARVADDVLGRERHPLALAQDQLGDGAAAADLRALGVEADGHRRVTPDEVDRRLDLLDGRVRQVDAEQVHAALGEALDDRAM